MTFNSDRELERLFHDARAADARRAPPFARVLGGRPTHRHRRALWPVLATAVALSAIAVVWRLTAAPEAPFVIRPGDLRVPTDYLLEVASYPRAGDIPSIGSVDWYPLTDRATNFETRRSQ